MYEHNKKYIDVYSHSDSIRNYGYSGTVFNGVYIKKK